MISGCNRVSEAIEGIRNLFCKTNEAGQPIDLNEIILDVMRSQQDQFTRRGVGTRHELMDGLPLVRGHRAQVREWLPTS